VPGLTLARGEASAAASLDVLILSGAPADVVRALDLLPQLDVAQEQVQLVAAVYEVSTGSSSASALSIAVGLFGSQVSIGGGSEAAPSLLRLGTGNVSAVLGRLAGDSRFRAVTSPSLLVRSGSEATLTSGSQVPVLGAVSFPGEGGTPVQSVEYRDSGVVLRVRPTVHGEAIDLDISQELSSFVRTETGVNTSPTLNRRALTNRLTLTSGEIVVLGGLRESVKDASRSGPLPFLGSRSRSSRETEVIVVLQAVRVADSRAPAAQRGRTASASVTVP
jgi:type II secretory pathway component GspD/PulD (secretin)